MEIHILKDFRNAAMDDYSRRHYVTSLLGCVLLSLPITTK